MSKHLKEHHWNFVRHPFTSVEIPNHLDIGYVLIVPTVANEIIAFTAKNAFEIFASTSDFHPRRWMAVMMPFVAVRRHFNATGIDSTVQSLMERHDLDILSLIGIGLFSKLEHSLTHAIIVVVLLELNTVISTPWMDVICIVFAPNTFRCVT